MTFRYIGAGADLGGAVLERFGQQIELSETDALALVMDSAVGLIPDAVFLARGFTADELKEFYAVALHTAAPASFLAKRDGLWADWHAWRARLGDPEEMTPTGDKDGNK